MRPDSLGSVLTCVVGRGPGLTPAGDDVLVGILAVLIHRRSGLAAAAAARLAGLIPPLLPTTTYISGQLLLQAMRGLFGRAVDELLSALTSDVPASATERCDPTDYRYRSHIRCRYLHGRDGVRAIISRSSTPKGSGMTTGSRYYANLYKDSVSLMTVSAKLTAVPGIEAASVVMASATNVENLAHAGLGEFEVRPNDLVVAVSGTRRPAPPRCRWPTNC